MKINANQTVEDLGGKGYHLRILEAIVDVPPFFTVLLENKDEINDTNIQKEILEYFDEMNFNLVSARSSATVEDSATNSFAGMFETELNVDRDNLIEAIKKVNLSVTNDRVIEYCKINNLDYNNLKMRTVIQKMVDSRISGVCFTKTADSLGSLLIETCLGLGEALVSGNVSPDTYKVNRDTLEVEKQSIGYQKKMLILNKKDYIEVPFHKRNARKITNDELKKLVEASLKIERDLSYKAVDIEWAFEKDKLYILQARAFTGVE